MTPPPSPAERRVLPVALLAIVTLLSAALAQSATVAGPPMRVQTSGPFMRQQTVVVAADRMVCSLLGNQQSFAGVVGEDGSHSVAVDGVVYWNFGDTILSDGSVIPNGIGWSTDKDASDCITLVPKAAAAGAASLLPQDKASELTVWPLGMEATASDTIHFFYASVAPHAELPWQVAGVGLASFDVETLVARRAFDGKLAWPAGSLLPSRTFSDERYVYIFLGASREDWTTDTILARVAKESIESLASYEYWNPGRGAAPGVWVSGLWDEQAGAWRPQIEEIGSLWRQAGMNNGIEVAYNEYLDRWLAVYASGFMTSINVRSAEDLTGPWDGPETQIVDCMKHHPPPNDTFVCYTGAQHELYSRDGGRTIYVSYSNGDDYQVYLHEIRLAAPVSQWSDRYGNTLLLPGDQLGPDGYTRDGLAFYASDIAAPGLAPIHRWLDEASGALRYAAARPQGPQLDLGVAFYAAADEATASATNAAYAPVYRWTQRGVDRYSPLNLEVNGFERQEAAFYAACPDGDGDWLSDCEESFLGTDPASEDSDGDGLPDGFELETAGCDPLVHQRDVDGAFSFEDVLPGANPCRWDYRDAHVERGREQSSS